VLCDDWGFGTRPDLMKPAGCTRRCSGPALNRTWRRGFRNADRDMAGTPAAAPKSRRVEVGSCAANVGTRQARGPTQVEEGSAVGVGALSAARIRRPYRRRCAKDRYAATVGVVGVMKTSSCRTRKPTCRRTWGRTSTFGISTTAASLQAAAPLEQSAPRPRLVPVRSGRSGRIRRRVGHARVRRTRAAERASTSAR